MTWYFYSQGKTGAEVAGFSKEADEGDVRSFELCR